MVIANLLLDLNVFNYSTGRLRPAESLVKNYFERVQDVGVSHQNSHDSPSRIIRGAWMANGMRFANLGLVRSDSKVFLFKLRRLKTSRPSETLLRFIPKARATRRSRVELNSVRKAPKSPRAVALTKNGPCSNPMTNKSRPNTSPS